MERKTDQVAPHVGAWIEIYKRINTSIDTRSHPTWVRGLKFAGVKVAEEQVKSHPTWVRGLKSAKAAPRLPHRPVAPHVGAWIEILVPVR